MGGRYDRVRFGTVDAANPQSSGKACAPADRPSARAGRRVLRGHAGARRWLGWRKAARSLPPRRPSPRRQALRLQGLAGLETRRRCGAWKGAARLLGTGPKMTSGGVDRPRACRPESGSSCARCTAHGAHASNRHAWQAVLAGKNFTLARPNMCGSKMSSPARAQMPTEGLISHPLSGRSLTAHTLTAR